MCAPLSCPKTEAVRHDARSPRVSHYWNPVARRPIIAITLSTVFRAHNPGKITRLTEAS